MELAAFAVICWAATFVAWRLDSRTRDAKEARLLSESLAKRGKLLDRIMARTYQEFTYRAVESEAPQLTSDEAEAAWYAAQQRDTLTEAS